METTVGISFVSRASAHNVLATLSLIELSVQMLVDGKSLNELDWTDITAAGAVGALAPG